MAQILVRNIDDQLKTRLQRRAKRNRRSMEAEAREILRDALRAEDSSNIGFGTATAALFRDCGFEEGEIRELRGFPVQPASFDE